MDERLRRAFDAVRADEDLKRRTRNALQGRQMRSAPRRRPMVAAFAALALVILTAAGGLAYATPAAAVSVDADTSVELAVNAFGRVVGVRCYDDTAQALVDATPVLHQDWTQAAAALSDALAEEGVTVTVSADSGHCERLLTAAGNAGLTCYALDTEDAQAARDAGLSLGKYRAYLALSALDPSVTQAEAGEMTMGELQQCIDACRGHAYGQQGYGQGNGNGPSTGESTSSGQGNGYGGHHGAGHGYGHE